MIGGKIAGAMGVSGVTSDQDEQVAGVPISLTGCQGPCKQAPVLSLRIADGSVFFAQVASLSDWQAILKFTREARLAAR